MDFFVYPAQLVAKPYYYDYINMLTLSADDSVELVYGESQGVRDEVTGQFTLTRTGDDRARLTLTGLQRSEQYRYEDDSAELPDMSIQISHETGVFAFRQEVMWRIDDPDEHPCLLYRVRYRLTPDPLLLPDSGTTGEADVALCYLPEDGQQLSVKTLREMGITPLSW